MRRGNTTTEEALKAELEADKRKQFREGGFKLMKERDRGWARLRPYYHSVQDVTMHWGADDTTLFKLEVQPYGGKTIDIILDAEELRKHLRWV